MELSPTFALKTKKVQFTVHSFKSRVSPLKQMTIPRLELTAAAVAVKMDRSMTKELQMPLEESMFWSDSTTVLRYIASENVRFKTFVANRVSLIRDNTKPCQWMYVNSELQPTMHPEA